MSKRAEILFEARTPLGFTVRVTRDRWRIITTVKHPAMTGCEAQVQEVLETPEQVRRSKSDANVYLFYGSRRERRWVCAVSKQEVRLGFLITAYPTDAIKEGEKYGRSKRLL